MTAAITKTNSVSLRAVLTALLGSACTSACTPDDAPASIMRDQNVCSCARNGLQVEMIDESVTVSLSRAALAALRRTVDLDKLLAHPDQKHKFAWNGTYHKVTISKDDLRSMIEEIWQVKTGFKITVTDVTIAGIVDAFDQAAAA